MTATPTTSATTPSLMRATSRALAAKTRIPTLSGTGESAFNVFDNVLGPGNDKWCCGDPAGIDEDNPMWVSAEFPAPVTLTHFTVSSANDAEGRDPIHWAVQGSNDGENYEDIYVYQDEFGPWLDRLEVILFASGADDILGDAGDEGALDFPVQSQSYTYLRLATFDTVNYQNGDGAYFQIGEIEFFGEMGPPDMKIGDFNRNDVLDAGDIDDLTQQSAGGTNPAAYDLNSDSLVNSGDINVWINDLFKSWVGDANLDGEFNSGDLVVVLASGAYEQDTDAVWTTGDFDGDGRSGSGDLVAALSGGGYEAGPKAAVAAVPEPSSLVLALLSFVSLVGTLRRRA